jgi:hypothetical protein
MAKKIQVEKFREVARELECDESAENFDAKLKVVSRRTSPKDRRRKDESRDE